MKPFLIACCAAVLAVAAPAQISGSINRNAPTVAHSISMGANKVEISYTAIRFGQGAWQKILENTADHEKFNAMAEKKPIGTVKTSMAVMAAGKEVPAGEYSMFFSVHEQAGWILNLKPANGEPIRWRLMLQASGTNNDCMKISLDPTATDGQCLLTVAFGSESVTVPVKAAGEKPAGDKPAGHKG